jgi:hypothetical protein
VRASFGVDLLELEQDWIRYMRKLK